MVNELPQSITKQNEFGNMDEYICQNTAREKRKKEENHKLLDEVSS